MQKNRDTWGALGIITLSLLAGGVAAWRSVEPSTKPSTLLTVSAPVSTSLVSVPPTTEPPTTTTLAPATTTTERVTTTTRRVSRDAPRTVLPTTTTTPVEESEPISTTEPEPVVEPDPEISGFASYEASWYGPGLYGNNVACPGYPKYNDQIKGVAHKTLACGTMVTFRHNGVTLTVPVIDRGPYIKGRTWDLTAGTCRALNHCYTGPIEARY